MLFYDRKIISNEYRRWLFEESEKIEPSNYEIEDCPESFMVFLQTKGFLNEESIIEYTRRKRV